MAINTLVFRLFSASSLAWVITISITSSGYSDGSDMVGGVVEDSIKLMGALNDTCLRLVLSLSEFAPEAGRKIKEIEKQIKRRSLTCRLFLQMTFLSSRLCLQHCHIFPSNFESTPCLSCHILPCVLSADFFCNL